MQVSNVKYTCRVLITIVFVKLQKKKIGKLATTISYFTLINCNVVMLQIYTHTHHYTKIAPPALNLPQHLQYKLLNNNK